MSDLEFSKTLKDLNLQMFKVINKRYKDLKIDLTPMQSNIIIIIAENKELLHQKDLEKFVSCNKSSLSSILDTMEKKELIIRVVDKLDTRKKLILLTKKSQDLINKISSDRKEVEKNISKGISKKEQKEFNEILNKILKNLERM